MITPLLCIQHVSKSFGGKCVVDDLSFAVVPGQTLGLLGPNGAGKTTTVGMICGLLAPDSGDILLNGSPVSTDTPAAKRVIGLVPQDIALYENLSALENLKLFGALYGLSGEVLKARCAWALDLVGLAGRATDRVLAFSGGMKRRLNIAAALLHEPQLLILDEPTVGVDPQSRNAIFDSLEELRRQGRSLIYTSHYMEEVERLADHIVIIDHGRIVADESPASLYQRLPAQAALMLDLDKPPSAALLAGLKQRTGVSAVTLAETTITAKLAHAEHALPLLNWLSTQDCAVLHFATAKANLEDVFLTLTGRSLRD